MNLRSLKLQQMPKRLRVDICDIDKTDKTVEVRGKSSNRNPRGGLAGGIARMKMVGGTRIELVTPTMST